MKKLLVLLAAFFVLNASIKAQYVTIPDDNLRAWIMQMYPSSFNVSNMLDTTSSAIVNETEVSVWGPNGSILNWDGFQYFRNLQKATFDGTAAINFLSYPNLPASLKELVLINSGVSILPDLPDGLTHLTARDLYNLVTLPVLPNSIVYIDCSESTVLQSFASLPSSLRYLNCSSDAAMTSFPAFPNSLDTLNCGYCNNITSLPTLPSSLKYLNCSNCMITSLPSLSASLQYLSCNTNNLSEIPALPAQLEYLDASYNHITNLPALPSTLQILIMENNLLVFIPDLPVALEQLTVNNNLISSLPELHVGLTKLECQYNTLTSLPLFPTGMLYLSCSNNQLTSIPDLPQQLQIFNCFNNLLTSVPALPNTIIQFVCNNNQLTSLPPLPHDMIYFDCSFNQIYFMPSLPDTLQNFYCHGNNITCLPVLPAFFYYGANISMDDKINCLPNEPEYGFITVWNAAQTNSINYPSGTYPLCSAINNIHHCDAFPLITGYPYNDNNNNNIKDANEPYRANIKVELSNGAFTMTNSNGYYQIPADSIGNYSITATAPNFFAAAPAQYDYNFNSYDTLVRGDFALQATTTVDSLTISVLPINFAARPGFAYPYLISYQNVGTTTLSPNIVFNYDNTKLNYDSSSNAAVTNGGSALSLSETGFVAGLQKAFVAYFTVKPSAVIGDSLEANVSISANAISETDSTITEITGAFDPNDKSATPALSPSQVVNGNYIYYTIRFQNTGTDTAFNVVITDTLNSQLQAATLQVINTSHPAKVTVTGNAVSFEFLNILLPDSNVNELKSHGYVTFRIKPQPTVVLNDIIPNKAAIYFDYNSPVLTNTAVTNIMEPVSPVPLKLLSFNVVRSIGNNANAFWNTSNEINVQSYNIEMSLDGRNFSNISYEKAKGYQYNDYTKAISIPKNDILYFRLKMIDVDGRFTYSPIVTLRNDKSQSFSFLNNPVKNELNISIQDDALKNTTAKIYNAQGVLVKAILLQHDIETVNLRSLAAGTYYLVTEKGSKLFVVVE